MKLDPAKFNRFLGHMGQDVSWRRSHDCPCRDPRSGEPSAACRVCTAGRIWEPAKCTRLALSGQKIQQVWQTMGLYENGDVVCTLPGDQPVYAMGEFDRVRFDDSSEPFSIAYPNKAGGPPTKLLFEVVSIDRLFWLNSGKTAIIDGSIPTVNEDGTLSFGSTAPPAGTQFTLTGRRKPEYFCFREFPQDRAHHGGEPLPRKVVLRNFDLFRRAA